MQEKKKGHPETTLNSPSDQESLERMRTELLLLRSRLRTAKIATRSGKLWEGKPMSYEDLKALATDYIRASYQYQTLKFGKVRVKMSVAKLLR
jgi:hypothetical protein